MAHSSQKRSNFGHHTKLAVKLAVGKALPCRSTEMVGRSGRSTEKPLPEIGRLAKSTETFGRSVRSTEFPLIEIGRLAKSTDFPFSWEIFGFKWLFEYFIDLFWCDHVWSIFVNLILKYVIVFNVFKSSLNHFKLVDLTWYVHFKVNHV